VVATLTLQLPSKPAPTDAATPAPGMMATPNATAAHRIPFIVASHDVSQPVMLNAR
jgi:hypothetical protein